MDLRILVQAVVSLQGLLSESRYSLEWLLMSFLFVDFRVLINYILQLYFGFYSILIFN